MAAHPQTFLGYRRADGSVGVRNHLVVIPSVICANTVAQRIASLIPGAIALPHPHGCAQVGDDVVLTERVLAAAAANPNVGAALVVGLGCETCQATDVAELARALAPGKPLESFYIQDAGGSIKAISKGVELGQRLFGQIGVQQRMEVPLSELVLATECSGLDESSQVASNPTVGAVSDAVLGSGGSVLLSETSDLIGAESTLATRARDADVAQRLHHMLERAQRSGDWPAAEGERTAARADNGSPSEMESLGCIAKAGSGPIQDVLPFGERPSGKGLFVMDAPAHDTVAMSAMAAGGAQVCLFTTGRGSPLGHALFPVIKVCGNPSTLRTMEDNIDFSTLPVLQGETSAERLAPELLRLLLDVCNGQLTNAEIIGHQEFAVHRIGPTV